MSKYLFDNLGSVSSNNTFSKALYVFKNINNNIFPLKYYQTHQKTCIKTSVILNLQGIVLWPYFQYNIGPRKAN